MCEFEAIFEKALTCVSGTQGKLFDEEKKQRSKISCQGPFNKYIPFTVAIFNQVWVILTCGSKGELKHKVL
jgi:hypothetical protein